MSQKSVEKLLGRLITDDDFRENAAIGFSQACFEAGLELTEAERGIIEEIDFERFAFLAGILDKRIKRSRRTLFPRSGPISEYRMIHSPPPTQPRDRATHQAWVVLSVLCSSQSRL